MLERAAGKTQERCSRARMSGRAASAKEGDDMLAFLVEIDGQRFTLAGAADWSVLACALSAGRGDQAAQNESRKRNYIEIRVAGLSTDRAGVHHHARWGEQQLKVGSRVIVTVVEVDSADEPIKKFRSNTATPESPFTEEEEREMRRQDYLELKKEFGDEA